MFRRKIQGRKRAAIRKLRIEECESRRVLATFTVTSLADDGPGTFRRAVETSNVQLGEDTIEFASDLSGGTISLSSGEVVVDGSLIITAADLAQPITISAAASDPCLLYTSPSPRDLSTSRMPSSA